MGCSSSKLPRTISSRSDHLALEEAIRMSPCADSNPNFVSKVTPIREHSLAVVCPQIGPFSDCLKLREAYSGGSAAIVTSPTTPVPKSILQPFGNRLSNRSPSSLPSLVHHGITKLGLHRHHTRPTSPLPSQFQPTRQRW
jgi:hypothetical protein